jgi:hypothetical protein
MKVDGFILLGGNYQIFMKFMERIKEMDPQAIAQKPEILAFWDKGLCWALAHRRAFKQFHGSQPPKDDFFDYQSKKEPIPLSEVELALLCWAGAGTNGLIRNDRTFKQNATTHPWFEGRVYPSACNVWFVHLFLANDDGVFLYRPHVPTRIVEIPAKDDLAVIFQAFKDGIVQLSSTPIWRVEQEIMEKQNKECITKSEAGIKKLFQPGVSYFFPIVDMTTEFINALLMLEGIGTRLFDEQLGKSAGLDEWVKKGYLKGKEVPLMLFEMGALQILIAHQYYIHQNLQLCSTAMGLGGYVTGGGFNALMCLHETLAKCGNGFRFAKDKVGYEYPVGIDRILETHMPPYMSIDEAVQDVYDMKFKAGSGRYSSAVKEGDKIMYPGFSPEPRAMHRPFKEPEKYIKAAWVDPVESAEIAKGVANHIFDNYNRFPRLYDPILCENFVQIAHIDLDFYRQYYVEGSVWEEHKEHMRMWHKLN